LRASKFDRTSVVKDAQVIVVGAGPVGATAAYMLARAGVDVILMEAGASCALDLRASTFHPPTLEMLNSLGLLDTLIEQGLKAPIYQYRNRITGSVIGFDMTELADATPFPFRLQCEQWKLAQLASNRLSDHPNGQTLMSHTVTSLDQDSDGVTVLAETPAGIRRFRADYVIGCDGGGSIVRRTLGIAFDGFTYPEKFLCLSTIWPLENHLKDLAPVSYLADPHEWMALVRVPSVWRILVPASGADSDETLVSDTKKNEIFERLIGLSDEVETDHRTIYRVHQCVAQSYRRGRALLAGDAAHLNNPLGGFGMNSGIHDIWNLVGKLVRVLVDNESPNVLDLYEHQRRTIMNEFVQTQTMRNKKNLESPESEREAELRATAADPIRRRNYLMIQSMLAARKRELEIV
jgi:3-(3-hydroxy-phenyl)propionate hydroxylase